MLWVWSVFHFAKETTAITFQNEILFQDTNWKYLYHLENIKIFPMGVQIPIEVQL